MVNRVHHETSSAIQPAPGSADRGVVPIELVDSLRRERDHLQTLVDVTNAVLSTLQIDDLVEEVARAIYSFLGVDYIGLSILDAESGEVHSHSVLFSADGEAQKQVTHYPKGHPSARPGGLGKHVVIAHRNELVQLVGDYPQFAALAEQGCQSLCVLPLMSSSKSLGALVLAYRQSAPIFSDNLTLLRQIAARIALALDNALAYQEISRLKDRLANENLVLSEEISNYESFDEIIGQSPVMSMVLEQVRIVAETDSSVLILGETGTGKELIARAIHNLSPRKKHRLVTMNCAAIPAGLLESDLFGHEKGSFTGAAAQRMGRFEMANQGTLFLDEIGDIPLELQPKLLRVLQEREVERVGGQKVIPVDVRVIAATSCDLPQMIAEKRYRSDLFYRLNVFPIVVPPLRERPEDIPLLAQFFTQKIARRINRTIESISAESIDRLMHHPWPGNVRELQNVIERAVILSRGPVLTLPQTDLQYDASVPIPGPVAEARPAPVQRKAPQLDDSTESERERIIRVLRETNGIVAGPKGAAARLGIKRTTLLSRMQRMGISVKSFEELD
jgi:formate hydrogenlyase transcriptional activator